jgi:hypothetical protein
LAEWSSAATCRDTPAPSSELSLPGRARTSCSGAQPGEARGSVLITGGTVSSGGGACDDLETLGRGKPRDGTYDGGALPYRVTGVTIYRKATLAQDAARVLASRFPAGWCVQSQKTAFSPLSGTTCEIETGQSCAPLGDEMNRTTKAVGIAVATVAAVGAGTGIALAATGDDSGGDTPITGDALERASSVALEHTGGGTVVDSEIDNDAENYYEVEVEQADGSITEVELSEDFSVVGSELEGSDDQNDDD